MPLSSASWTRPVSPVLYQLYIQGFYQKGSSSGFHYNNKCWLRPLPQGVFPLKPGGLHTERQNRCMDVSAPFQLRPRGVQVKDDGVTSQERCTRSPRGPGNIWERAGPGCGPGRGPLDPEETFKVILKVTHGP